MLSTSNPVPYSPGPFKKDFQPSTGFGCGYGQSQILDTNGQPIAGVALVAPPHGTLHDGGEYSQAAFDCLEANASLFAASWSLLEKLHVIERMLTQHPDASRGNSVVHFALWEARNAIALADPVTGRQTRGAADDEPRRLANPGCIQDVLSMGAIGRDR